MILLTRTTVPEDVDPKQRRAKEQTKKQDSYQHLPGHCSLSVPLRGQPLFCRTLWEEPGGEKHKIQGIGREEQGENEWRGKRMKKLVLRSFFKEIILLIFP
jgi:hypothetical protein